MSNGDESMSPAEFAKLMGAYPEPAGNPLPAYGGYMDNSPANFAWVNNNDYFGAETFEAEGKCQNRETGKYGNHNWMGGPVKENSLLNDYETVYGQFGIYCDNCEQEAYVAFDMPTKKFIEVCQTPYTSQFKDFDLRGADSEYTGGLDDGEDFINTDGGYVFGQFNFNQETHNGTREHANTAHFSIPIGEFLQRNNKYIEIERNVYGADTDLTPTNHMNNSIGQVVPITNPMELPTNLIETEAGGGPEGQITPDTFEARGYEGRKHGFADTAYLIIDNSGSAHPDFGGGLNTFKDAAKKTIDRLTKGVQKYVVIGMNGRDIEEFTNKEDAKKHIGRIKAWGPNRPFRVLLEPLDVEDGDYTFVFTDAKLDGRMMMSAETFEATPKWECDACGDMHDDENDAESCCVIDCDHSDSEMTSWGGAYRGSEFWMTCNNCGADGYGTFDRINWEHGDGKELEHEQTAETFEAYSKYGVEAHDMDTLAYNGHWFSMDGIAEKDLHELGYKSRSAWRDSRKYMREKEEMWRDSANDMDNLLTAKGWNAETFEAPYGGVGAIMDIGKSTPLENFTDEELTTSSAIHGDFDKASLDYSGHQNIEVRAEEEELYDCLSCGEPAVSMTLEQCLDCGQQYNAEMEELTSSMVDVSNRFGESVGRITVEDDDDIDAFEDVDISVHDMGGNVIENVTLTDSWNPYDEEDDLLAETTSTPSLLTLGISAVAVILGWPYLKDMKTKVFGADNDTQEMLENDPELIENPDTGDLDPAQYEELVVESTGLALDIIPMGLDGSFMGSRFAALPTERYVEYNDPGIGAHTDIAINRDEIFLEPEMAMVQAAESRAFNSVWVGDSNPESKKRKSTGKSGRKSKGKSDESEDEKEERDERHDMNEPHRFDAQAPGQSPYMSVDGQEPKDFNYRVIRETHPISLDPAVKPFIPQSMSGYTGNENTPPSVMNKMFNIGVLGQTPLFVAGEGDMGSSHTGSRDATPNSLGIAGSVGGPLSDKVNANYTDGTTSMSLAQWAIENTVSQSSDTEAVVVDRSSGAMKRIRRV